MDNWAGHQRRSGTTMQPAVLVAVAARSLAEHEDDVSIPQFRSLVVLASRGPQRPVDLLPPWASIPRP